MGWLFKLNGEFVDEPIGFDAIEFTAKRLESHGVDQPFSTDLTFDGRSAILLKQRFDQSFINNNPSFEIISDQKVNGFPWSFLGYVDMSTYSQVNDCDIDSFTVTVGILEDNFREQFKSRSDVEVDLTNEVDLNQNAIDPITFTVVRLHSQELYLKAFARSLNKTTNFILNASTDPLELSLVLPFYFQNSDFKGAFELTANPSGIRRSDFNVCFKNNTLFTRTITAKGTGNFSVFPDPQLGTGGNVSFQVFAKVFEIGNYGVGTLFTHLYDSPSYPVSVLSNGTFSFEQEFTILPDYGLVIQFGYNNDGGWSLVDTDVTFANGIELTITEINSGFASFCRGQYIFDYLNRLLWVLTGSQNMLISDYFSIDGSGCEWNNLLTSGIYIRNAQLVNKPNGQIKTSWKKIFDYLDKIFCLGWGYDYQNDGTWKIRVESRSYFYQNTQISNCEEPDQVRQYSLSDKLKNNLRIGFDDKWKNIAVSGIFEIHTDRSYFVKNKAVADGTSATEDLRSGIICSGYAIEFSRRLQFLRDDSGSSDRPNDYETFLIWLNREELTINTVYDPGYSFPGEFGNVTFQPGKVSYGSNFLISSNAPIDRIYNVRHTPARVAIRQWKWIGMHTFGLSDTDAKLFFQTGEYFTTYSSEIQDDDCLESQPGEIFENQDIFKDTMKPEFQKYILKPIGLDLQYPQSLCEFQSMGFPGLGYVRIEQAGSVYYGYLEESSNQPVDPQNGLTNFKLILANNAPLLGDYSDDYSDDYNN